MTAVQIASAKERFLEKALDLLHSALDDGADAVSLVEETERLTDDTITLFAALLRCDEQHNLLGATSDDYPYLAAEEELTALFQWFLAVCEGLRALSSNLQGQGYEPRNLSSLESVCSHTCRLIQDDQTLYETEAYRVLAERAHAEYQSGQVEEWPVQTQRHNGRTDPRI